MPQKKTKRELMVGQSRSMIMNTMLSYVPLQQLRFSVLFSFRDKYIFFPIGKVANSSLKWMFYMLEGRGVAAYKNKWKGMEGFVHDQFYGPLIKLFQLESSPVLVENLLGSKKYKKIAFVRNPYSRLLSAYQDRAQAPRAGLHKAYELFLSNSGISWEDNSFANFVDFVVSHVDIKSMDPHIRPQYNCLFCGDIEMDFIGKMESMQEELIRLEALLNVRLPIMGFQSPAKTNSDEKLVQFYTPELRRRVADFYSKDFSTYGYPV